MPLTSKCLSSPLFPELQTDTYYQLLPTGCPKALYSTNRSWYPPLFNFLLLFSHFKSCPTLCNPMDCSTPGFPVLYQLPEFAHTCVHCVGKAIRLSHPTSPPLPVWLMVPHPSSSQVETRTLSWSSFSVSSMITKSCLFRLLNIPPLSVPS